MTNKANEKLVMDFFESMGPTLADTLKAYEKYMHPNAIWKNSGFPDCVGIEAMKHLLTEQKRLFDFERVRVLDHRYLGSTGDRVFFERQDSICDAQGNVRYAFDISGMFQIQDGRIVAWHDYMDTTSFRKDWEAKGPVAVGVARDE